MARRRHAPGDGPHLEALQRLREKFLEAEQDGARVADYWTGARELEAYDAVFAERIGWKWDAVLDELAARGFARADGELVADWGCGTGIAVRRFVSRFGAGRARLHDRSPRARDFARDRLATQEQTLDIGVLGPDDEPDVLLVSHVLNELDTHGERSLLDLLERSRRVVWVEPGSRVVSRRLSAIRDALRDRFSIVAPCTHRAACGALTRSETDWCHFFATPPAEVFQSGDWVRLARTLRIDLRALPYAFVALSRNDRARPEETARVVGRPKLVRREIHAYLCDASGVDRVRIDARHAPELFRELKKHPNSVRRICVTRDHDRVVGGHVVERSGPPRGGTSRP